MVVALAHAQGPLSFLNKIPVFFAHERVSDDFKFLGEEEAKEDDDDAKEENE